MQLKIQAESVTALRSELEAQKQAHGADQQRWSQKASLLQGQLDQAQSQLREAHAQARQQRHALKKLKSQAEQAQAQLQHDQGKVHDHLHKLADNRGALLTFVGKMSSHVN